MTAAPETRLVLEGTTFDGLKRFGVFLGEERIGQIEQYHPTFERAPRGSRIVTKRWKSKRIYWINATRAFNGYRLPFETRKRAIESVVSEYQRNRDLGFVDGTKGGAGGDSIKQSHRGEGENFVG